MKSKEIVDVKFSRLAISFHFSLANCISSSVLFVRIQEQNANQDSAFFVTSKVSVSINISVMKTTLFSGRFSGALTRLHLFFME